MPVPNYLNGVGRSDYKILLFLSERRRLALFRSLLVFEKNKIRILNSINRSSALLINKIIFKPGKHLTFNRSTAFLTTNVCNSQGFI